jgi:hypothetical protein
MAATVTVIAEGVNKDVLLDPASTCAEAKSDKGKILF